VQKFQKVTRQELPFQHYGYEYAETNQGFSITQKNFAEKLTHTKVPSRAEESKLLPEEVPEFRSILGALLWVTSTKLDVVSDVSLLQSRVTVAEVRDIKVANSVVDKVKAYSDVGLYYRFIESNHQRVVCVHDSSSASKGRHYAQEGILVMLADDHWRGHQIDHKYVCDEYTVAKYGGAMHVLHSHGAKAKRVSYSTSHSETLAMVNIFFNIGINQTFRNHVS
jgi:hypothetical protein